MDGLNGSMKTIGTGEALIGTVIMEIYVKLSKLW